MDETEIIDFAREAIVLVIQISAPVLIVGLVVGVIISLFQALTQIQEMSLTFVPKIMAIFATIFVCFPMFITALGGFTEKVAAKIANIG